MVHDPVMEIQCDGCEDIICFNAEYKYRDYSGNGGYYDFDDKAIKKFIEKENWITKGDQQFCEDCDDED